MSDLIKATPSSLPQGPVFYDTYSARNWNTTPLTLSGLEGDIYDITFVLRFDNSGSDSDMDITFNSDATANYRNRYLKGLSTSPTANVGSSDNAIELKNVLGTSGQGLVIMSITGDSSGERKVEILYSGDTAILKQISAWKDTTNELTSVTFTGAVSTTANATIARFQTPKLSNSHNWVLVETQTWTTQNLNTTPISFTGLNGDTDLLYKCVASGDNKTFGMRINSDSGSNYLSEWMVNDAGSPFAFNFTDVDIYPGTSADFAEYLIHAETGQKRLVNVSQGMDGTGAYDQVEFSSWYSNTATEVTSLQVVYHSSETGTGEASLYKIKNPNTVADWFNLPFKQIGPSIDVSGDYSAGTTFSNITGNSTLLLKLEGLLSTVGNELRVQVGADTGTNYDEQEIEATSGSLVANAVTSANHWVIADASSSKVCNFELYIWPQDGDNRQGLLITRHNETILAFKSLVWNDTTTDLDSLKIFASSTTTCTGQLKLSYIPLPEA